MRYGQFTGSRPASWGGIDLYINIAVSARLGANHRAQQPAISQHRQYRIAGISEQMDVISAREV